MSHGRTIDYSFGHDELTQTTRTYDEQGDILTDETLVFGHDSHGSVRLLTDLAGTVAQFYLYDAYGQLLAIWNDQGTLVSGGANGQLANASAALTSILYSGEQFDSRIGQQYLRGRWYDPTIGRFNRLDPFFGNQTDPQSFHKYLYTHADPVNQFDPSGWETIAGLSGAMAGAAQTMAMSGLVVGAGYGAIRGFADSVTAANATWTDVLWSTLSATVWGGAYGLVFGYASPYLLAAGPWAVGGAATAGALYSVYNTQAAVQEAWNNGNELQAGVRLVFGVFDTVISIFGAHSAFSAKYGPRTAKISGTSVQGTPLPGPKTMDVLRVIMRRFGIEDIVIDPSKNPGTGAFSSSAHKIFIHPDSSLSILVHEMMHGLHYWNHVIRGGGTWSTIKQGGPQGREQAAFTLVYRLFRHFMSADELQAHANYLRYRGGDPTLLDKGL